MSRSNETDSDLLAGSLREAITKRRSGIGKCSLVLSTKKQLASILLSTEYLVVFKGESQLNHLYW